MFDFLKSNLKVHGMQGSGETHVGEEMTPWGQMDMWALIVFYMMESLGSWDRFEEVDGVSLLWLIIVKLLWKGMIFFFLTRWMTSLSQSILKAMDIARWRDPEQTRSVPMEFGAPHGDLGKGSGSPTQKLSGPPPFGCSWFEFLTEASLSGHERLNHWPLVADLECWCRLHGHLPMSETGQCLQLQCLNRTETVTCLSWQGMRFHVLRSKQCLQKGNTIKRNKILLLRWHFRNSLGVQRWPYPLFK